MKSILLTLSTMLYCTSIFAQTPSRSSSDILQKIKQLNAVGSVLYIAAHPDDENTRLLPYLTYERKLRTAYLSLTRGDGGQNLIGKEQGEALGLIRTQELLGARRIDGAEQFFSRANDFGFSKSPEETLEFWNKDSILSDVVWVIRTFKPDVIITRFPTTGEGGHGHHTASAMLAVEAFSAAADAKRFPEQLKYTEVWQAKRIFWNTFNFGGKDLTGDDQLKIDIGGFNVLVGKSYGELASENRSMHKSQGFGTPKTRGHNKEYFKQLAGDVVNKDVFENITMNWGRFPETQKFSKQLDKIISSYNTSHPEESIPALISFYKALKAVKETNGLLSNWKKLKLIETENILLSCGGIWIEAYADDYIAIPGNKINTTVQFIKRSSISVTLNALQYIDEDSSLALAMSTDELYTFKHKGTLPAKFSSSNPYWLNEIHTSGLYTVTNQRLIGKPETEPTALVTFTITIQDLTLTIQRPLVYKYTDPVKGEIYRPLEILPAATVNLAENVYVFSDTLPKKITVVVKANKDSIHGSLDWVLPEGWSASCANTSFSLHKKGEEVHIDLVVHPIKKAASGALRMLLKINNDTVSKSITRVEYDHIPYQFILSEAKANLVNIDLNTKGKRIGYIPGAGDDVATCLKQVGYDVTLLTDDVLDKGNLYKYDAIVTGIRAYNTNMRLEIYHSSLMEYVKGGGNLIVQYNTNNRLGPLSWDIGPYPFTVSRDRVTDEKAEVRMVLPKHSAFHYPNEITAKDFEGWIQERGIYFATEIDERYESLLSMNDANEKPSEGSLIIGKYGKGNFVYTGLVFFRELPAGVPGAYRLLVNLISLPKN